MSKLSKNRRTVFFTFGCLVALLILADFSLPGTVFQDTIIHVKKERQQYYNAARNYHYTYKAITSNHQFFIKENVAPKELENKTITYAISPLFKNVNWYTLPSSKNKSFHSLRLFSGLALPLLSILSIFWTYRYHKKINILVGIIHLILLGDLLFLIFY